MAPLPNLRDTVGDECWFVEWCSKLAFYPDSEDVDHDNCTMKRCRVATWQDAERVAREVWPQTTQTFGVVSYWPAQFVAYDEEDASRYPHAGFWEATAEEKYFEGE